MLKNLLKILIDKIRILKNIYVEKAKIISV